MNWTHRRTWPDHRATDRVICLDGKVIARVYDFEHGPQAGTWAWFGQWMGAPNSGVVPTLAEALETVRGHYQRQMSENRPYQFDDAATVVWIVMLVVWEPRR